jgi:hypothetical protein
MKPKKIQCATCGSENVELKIRVRVNDLPARVTGLSDCRHIVQVDHRSGWNATWTMIKGDKMFCRDCFEMRDWKEVEDWEDCSTCGEPLDPEHPRGEPHCIGQEHDAGVER